jgi:hypothetical protein
MSRLLGDRSSILGMGRNLHYHDQTKSCPPSVSYPMNIGSYFPGNYSPIFYYSYVTLKTGTKSPFLVADMRMCYLQFARRSYIRRISGKKRATTECSRKARKPQEGTATTSGTETKARLFISVQGWSLWESSQEETVGGT